MLREAHIPLLLWLPAAVLIHLAGGGGAVQFAKTVVDKMALLAFSRSVRTEVREALESERIEVALLDDSEKPEEEKDPDKDDPSSKDLSDEASKEQAKPEPPKPLPITPQKPTPPAQAQLPKPPPPEQKKTTPLVPVKPQEQKPAPKPPEKQAKKEEEKKPEEKKKAQQLELPKPDGRIAVINDPSTDKNQKDNPNAKRIADHANTVKDESMARYRSYDQNASKPTGGGRPEEADPSLTDPGNAQADKRGHSVDNEDPGDPRPGSEKGSTQMPEEAIARSPSGSNEPMVGQKGTAAQKGVKGREAGEGEARPETIGSAKGGWKISADGGDGKEKKQGKKGRLARKGTASIPGVPIPGKLPGKYSINAYGLMEALGEQHLRQEQERARNTRLSKHRGRFKGNQFQKYRAAIENYDPSVKPGNQTSLNAARVPFASYINKMHNRIHPIFADGFLGSLDKVSGDDKLSNMKLFSHVEMVLDGSTGKVIRAGIVKPSGVTAFDVGALSSLEAAGPFGRPPDVIVSPDGKVYIHWEFYRDPYYACTSKFARPYIIDVQPKDGPGAPPPQRPPGGSQEPQQFGSTGPLRPTQ